MCLVATIRKNFIVALHIGAHSTLYKHARCMIEGQHVRSSMRVELDLASIPALAHSVKCVRQIYTDRHRQTDNMKAIKLERARDYM